MFKGKTFRDQDLLYLDEDRYENVKDSFKFSLRCIKSILDDFDGKRILDIGCATGEFIYFAKGVHPEASYVGADHLLPLVEKARKNVDGAEFHQASILDDDFAGPLGEFDFVYMAGTLGIFDDFEVPLNNCLKVTKPGGTIGVLQAFNSEPVDVLIRYRDVSKKSYKDYGEMLETGWNAFSTESVGHFLTHHPDVAEFEFLRYHLPDDFDLPRRENEPVRSWTSEYLGEKVLTNGMRMIMPRYFLRIKKK